MPLTGDIVRILLSINHKVPSVKPNIYCTTQCECTVQYVVLKIYFALEN